MIHASHVATAENAVQEKVVLIVCILILQFLTVNYGRLIMKKCVNIIKSQMIVLKHPIELILYIYIIKNVNSIYKD